MRRSIRLLTSLLVLLIPAIFIATAPASAQTEATQLASLAVELWPDYDRPAMLVLLTGELPEGAAPATLTIPIPADADVNAVARFDENGGLISDVDYTVEDGRLTLTTPADRFRVEYYVPYAVDENEYSYTFDWTSDLGIDQITTVVQQPIAALDFRVNPAAASSAADRGDGLNYHTLPARAVGAGEPYSVDVAYNVDAPILSAPSQDASSQSAAVPETDTSTTATGGFQPWWLLVAAGVLALVTAAWYLGQRQGRGASRARKPQPVRPANPAAGKSPAASGPPPAARYCHSCGQPAQPSDAFCRNCGAQLKVD